MSLHVSVHLVCREPDSAVLTLKFSVSYFPYSQGVTIADRYFMWQFLHQMAFLTQAQRDFCLLQGEKPGIVAC